MGARSNVSTDQVTFAGAGIPDPNAAITITAWVKLAVDQNNFCTFARISNAGGSTVGNLATAGDGVSPGYFTGGGSISPGRPLPLAEWRPVAFASTGTAAKLYQGDVNGDLEFTDTGSADGAASPTRIALFGRGFGDASEWLDGSLAYVRLWSAELTPEQIEAEWKSANHLVAADLVADWSLEGASLLDVSGNDRHLTAGSTALEDDPGPELAGPSSPWTLWDGATEQPLTLSGVWDGAAVQPLTFDQITT